MQLSQLYTDDDRGVSPVIGVILMVAITVILAAVIATFVLGLGESVSNTAPQASFKFNPNDNTIVMTNGNEINGDYVGIKGDINVSPSDTPGTITAGTDVINGKATFSSNDTVRVVWNNGEGSSATLGSYNT